MVSPLRTVVVKRPEEAFGSTEAIRREWAGLGYTRPPDFARACRDHARLVSILESAGVEVLRMPTDANTTLDSLYVHDPVLMTDLGAVILQTGKNARRREGPALARSLDARGIPILGNVGGDGTAEAGDMVWLDERTLLVGRGFRTNAEGIRQLQALLGPLQVDVIHLHLPYAEGPEEVLHLMSFLSLIDRDLAVVYRRLLPVPLFEILTERGVRLVDVPEEEYATLGANVLALAPRKVIVVRGNAVTRSRLERAGCEVSDIDGGEICLPGAGGPTCLTRPLWRAS